MEGQPEFHAVHHGARWPGRSERSEEKQLRKLLDGTLDKFNHLTGNQYITKIDDAMLMRLITDNRMSEEMTPPVVHALLLSLKFTLSDFLINGEAAIPLLIDEPFQFMDDERCNRFRDLVSYISNKRQVIIFTHHSNKRNWGNYHRAVRSNGQERTTHIFGRSDPERHQRGVPAP